MNTLKNYGLIVCLTAWALHMAPSAGAADFGAAASATNGAPAESNGRIDRYHEELSDRLGRYLHHFDCFLAGRTVIEEPTGSWVRVIPRAEVEDGKGFSVGSSFKSRIILPHLHDRLELIADNVPGGILPGKDIAPDQYDRVKAGLRYKVLRDGLSMVDLDGGINLNPMPAPFGKLMLSHAFVWANCWSLELSQQGFLYINDDGFGEISQIELTRALASGSFARAISAATWSEETDGVEWEQTFMLWRELSNRRTIESSLSFFGHVDSSSVMDNYRVNTTYRWSVWRSWVFLGITPQISFPSDRDFRLTPMLRFFMEITLGDF